MISYTLLGFEQVDQILATLGEGARRAANKALDEGAEVIAERARQLAPGRRDMPRTWKDAKRVRLHESIVVSRTLGRKSDRRRNVRAQLERFIGPTVSYAHLVEFGHRIVRRRGRRTARSAAVELGRVRAYPYMRPAADQTRQQVQTLIADRMSSALVAEFNRQARVARARDRAFARHVQSELAGGSFVLDEGALLGVA